MPIARPLHLGRREAGALVVAVGALLVGCNVPGEPVLREGDVEPPQVVRTSPAEGEAGVSRELTFEAEFDEQLDPRTLRGGFQLVQGAPGATCETGTVIPSCVFRPNDAEIAAGAPYVVRVVPGTESGDDAATCARTTLAANSQHAVCIATSVTDLAGNALAEPAVITFTTEQ